MTTPINKVTGSYPRLKPASTTQPAVRIPLAVKIILPYTLLALLLASVGVIVAARVTVDTVTSRLNAQLETTTVTVVDGLVDAENEMLAVLRIIANTTGVADAIVTSDSDQMRLLTVPVMTSNRESRVIALNLEGDAILDLHVLPGGERNERINTDETKVADVAAVQQVLAGESDGTGDKFAGVFTAQEETGQATFVFVAGPVFDAAGERVGALLIARPLARYGADLRQQTGATVSLYDLEGEVLDSNLLAEDLPDEIVNEALADGGDRSLLRSGIELGGAEYVEIIVPWRVRGETTVGLVGVALAQDVAAEPADDTQFLFIGVVVAGFVLVVLTGVLLATQITRPIREIVRASGAVADGDLGATVEPRGSDEVADLARTFNLMVENLHEGSIYRDLLGRTVSPEVRKQLRNSFAAGDIDLSGQEETATMLMTDIRGFSAISEQHDATTTLNWLNEYYGVWLPIVAAHDGVVHEFSGDGVLTFFGVLPQLLSPQESAYNACKAGEAILQAMARLNERRVARGDPVFHTGIGINTGDVTMGGLGTTARLHFAVLGDTVNTTQRLQSFTRNFGSGGLAVGGATVAALGSMRDEFDMESLGKFTLKGKTEAIGIFRLWMPGTSGKTALPKVLDA